MALRAALPMTALATLCGCKIATAKLTRAQRGAVIYRTNCVSCHGRDPHFDGPIGPAIAGSPRALLEARVLHRSYPARYLPKRRTHLMQAMPWMASHLDDLTAYLAATGSQAGAGR